MAIHLHHPHHHPHLPLRYFEVEHPFARDWALLGAGAVVAFLLWYWNH